MYFVGIDCSKYKHDCFIATETGAVIKDTFTFDNSGTGFAQFFSVLDELNCPKTQIKIGFESTSHYMIPLMKHLSVKGYEFILLNPVIVSRFRKSTTLRRVKTDKVDAKTIAQVLASYDFESYQMQVYHFPELKSLTRFRDRLIKQRSYYLVMLTNVLDEVFPEFKGFFDDSLKSKTAFYLLDTYKIPSRLANMNSNSFSKLKTVSRGKFSYAKFIKIKELAKNTIGSSSDADELEISSLLNIYKLINDEICRVESKIEEINLKKYASNSYEEVDQTSMDKRLEKIYLEELEQNIKAKFEDNEITIIKCTIDAELDTSKKNAGIHLIKIKIKDPKNDELINKIKQEILEEYEISEEKLNIILS